MNLLLLWVGLRQSGVGTAVFEQGGLVVDAGKNTKDPTQKIIPLICRQPFPDEWRFVVAIPNVKKGLANEAEASAFKHLPPMPARRCWQNLPINHDEASSSRR